MSCLQEARVWVPEAELVWKGAVLVEDYNGQKELRVEDEDGRVSFTEDMMQMAHETKDIDS